MQKVKIKRRKRLIIIKCPLFKGEGTTFGNVGSTASMRMLTVFESRQKDVFNISAPQRK